MEYISIHESSNLLHVIQCFFWSKITEPIWSDWASKWVKRDKKHKIKGFIRFCPHRTKTSRFGALRCGILHSLNEQLSGVLQKRDSLQTSSASCQASLLRQRYTPCRRGCHTSCTTGREHNVRLEMWTTRISSDKITQHVFYVWKCTEEFHNILRSLFVYIDYLQK